MNAEGMRGRETMIFPIKEILPPKGKQWKLGQEAISNFDKRGDLFIRNKKIIIRKRPEDETSDLTEPFWGLLTKDLGTAETGKKELTKVLNSDKHGFETVKPTSLIKRIIFHSTSKEDIILDFFAGSGTTGDALMQLNYKDCGSRKYILVQLPEKINSDKDKTAYNYVKNELKVNEPTIFEITKERLVKAGEKIDEDNKKSKEPKDLSNIDFGFKIFETIPIWEDYNLEAEEFSPQTKLFDESKLSEEDLKTLLTTWKTYDGFPLTRNLKKIDLGGYTGYYLDNKLYLVNKGFETKHLKKLLEEIDTNKDFKPAIIIVFGYDFESKILREIADNVKSYANKKHIDVDFITRY
jgi:adenine-specific DNA-methyltransferase